MFGQEKHCRHCPTKHTCTGCFKKFDIISQSNNFANSRANDCHLCFRARPFGKICILLVTLCVEMPFTRKEKAFVCWSTVYIRTQSNKIVQRVFVREFSKNAPTAQQIWTEEGCLCRAKGSGWPPASEEMVEWVRRKLLRNPKKSIWRASLETRFLQQQFGVYWGNAC